MNNPTRLTVIPNLLVEHGRIDRSLRDGETIADAMRAHGWTPEMVHARVSIDGRMIPSAQWESITPVRGSSIVIRRVPMGGGGGGGGGKQTGQLIGMIAVMALAIAAPYAAPGLVAAMGGSFGGLLAAGTWGGTLLSAGVGISGMLAMRALIPPPLPTLKKEIAHAQPVSISVRTRRHDQPSRIARREGADHRRAGARDRQELATGT